MLRDLFSEPEYQQQLNRLREALQPAAERFERGDEAVEIDIDQLIDDELTRGQRSGDQES
jgi:hypothetical protein